MSPIDDGMDAQQQRPASSRRRRALGLIALAVIVMGVASLADLHPIWMAKPKTAQRLFTPGVKLISPEGIVVAPDGSVYFSDFLGGYVFRVQQDRSLVTIVGASPTLSVNASNLTGGDGGPATRAYLLDPAGLAVDPNGDVLVADYAGQRIRRIDRRGMITTLAGSGRWGYGRGSFSGDGGPATAATLSEPLGLAFDGGVLYVGDSDNGKVRRIEGDGTISSLKTPSLPAPLWAPGYLTFDLAGNLYASDKLGCRIVRLTPGGTLSIVAGTGTCGFSGDGGPANAAFLDDPEGLAVDSAGNLYFADSNNYRIRRIDTKGIITTVAGTGLAGLSGDGSLGTKAQLQSVFGLAMAPGDLLYIAEASCSCMSPATPGRIRLLRLSDDIITTVVNGTSAIRTPG